MYPVRQETLVEQIRGLEQSIFFAVMHAQESYPICPQKGIDLLIPMKPAYSIPILCSWLGILRAAVVHKFTN